MSTLPRKLHCFYYIIFKPIAQINPGFLDIIKKSIYKMEVKEGD